MPKFAGNQQKIYELDQILQRTYSHKAILFIELQSVAYPSIHNWQQLICLLVCGQQSSGVQEENLPALPFLGIRIDVAQEAMQGFARVGGVQTHTCANDAISAALAACEGPKIMGFRSRKRALLVIRQPHENY